MNAKDRDKDIVSESERCRGGRMRGKDKHDAKNTSPPYEFSSIGIDNVCWNKAVSLLFHYSLCFVYSIYSEPQEEEKAWVSFWLLEKNKSAQSIYWEQIKENNIKVISLRISNAIKT